MKKFKVSYSYPLEHPIKVVITNLGLKGIVGWLMQKFGNKVDTNNLIITERIIELPTLHEWIGGFFPQPQGEILEIGHVASSTSLELANLGFQVTAIDLRDYQFKHPNLTSIRGDFLTHQFNKKFDSIFSLSTIEHFGFSERYGGQDIVDNNLDEEAFEKISKLLNIDGKVILSFPYAKQWVPGIWFRVYTREVLIKKLSTFFNIIESRFYRRDKNIWSKVVGTNDDPDSPHDGVALFLLSNK